MELKKKEKRDISFLGRVLLFFKNLKNKFKEMRLVQRTVERQKALAGIDGEDCSAEARASFGFGMAKVISITVLCVFLIVALVFGGSIISYENVYYMFKDIGYISSFSESRPASLSYSAPFTNQDFTSFKNGLAVVGDSEIKLFTSTGRVTMTAGISYTNPKICASDSSVLVFDQGRNSFSVYNSFISVFSDTLDYPISSAHMADDGSFCIVTKSREYSSVVRVYDNKFNLEMEYSKNDYIISARMSDDGKRIAVVSLASSGGESRTVLNVIERGNNTPESTVTLNGKMPYFAEFIAGDRIALICSDSAHVYDLDCKRKNMFEFPYALSEASVTDGGVALLFNENGVGTESVLAVLDVNGKLKHTDRISGGVIDARLFGDDVILLQNDGICKVDAVLGSKSVYPFSEENSRLVVFENGDVWVCTPTVAYYIFTD